MNASYMILRVLMYGCSSCCTMKFTIYSFFIVSISHISCSDSVSQNWSSSSWKILMRCSGYWVALTAMPLKSFINYIPAYYRPAVYHLCPRKRSNLPLSFVFSDYKSTIVFWNSNFNFYSDSSNRYSIYNALALVSFSRLVDSANFPYSSAILFYRSSTIWKLCC